MILFYKKYGNGTPLIILHGLYGSGDNWMTIGKKLAEHFEVYLVDQRNHGNSPHDSEHNYSVMAYDLLKFCEINNLKKINIIGHSMGGKTAMIFTQLFPEIINKLIIADISPRSYLNSEESEEHYRILNCLQKINFKICKSYKDIDAQLNVTLHDERLRNFLLKNVKREGKRCFSWKINIPVLFNELSSVLTGINENIIIQSNTLFIRGALSNHVPEIDFELIKKIFKTNKIITIENAGHWVHADKPAEFLKLVIEFLM